MLEKLEQPYTALLRQKRHKIEFQLDKDFTRRFNGYNSFVPYEIASLILTNNNSQNFSRLLESQTHERDLPREPAFAPKGDG